MAKVDYAALASQLLNNIGGEENISSMTHCATRMRFVLKDESKASTEAVKALDGVVTVVQAGGQYQVVIGNDVPLTTRKMPREPVNLRRIQPHQRHQLLHPLIHIPLVTQRLQRFRNHLPHRQPRIE